MQKRRRLRGCAERGLRAGPIALLLAGACPAALWAQSAPAPSSTQTQSQGQSQGQSQPPAQTPAPAQTREPPKGESIPADENPVAEVVVNGHRTQVGAVVGDIKPEIQLTPADIQSFGVSTVTELLNELGPEVRSDRGRGGSSPVILLNGRRISSFSEIQNIPTEAILRVDILPEEVSLKYGYTADQRVVNIVLRRRFRATTGEIKGGGPTEGGQVEGQAEGDLLHLHNDDRLNLDLKYTGNSDLTAAARDVNATAASSPFSLGGNITPGMGASQIDPALSALAGRTVTVAGVPGSAATTAPTLASFLPTAGVASTSNLAQDRTLLPDSQAVNFNGVWSHGVLGGISLTLNGSLGTSQTDALQGLPGVNLTLPVGDPYSPFSQPVTLSRYVSAFGPLTQTVNGWTGHLGATANKDKFGWRFSLTGAYDHADSLTVSQTGLNAAGAQALLTALSPSFNPYGPLSSSLFAENALTKARALSDTANAQFLGNGPLAHLPAGDLYASIKFGDTVGIFSSLTDRFSNRIATDLSRNDFNAQVNMDLPVLKHTFDGGWGLIGDLSLNGNVAVDELSDFGRLMTLGYGLNWTPIKGVNLIVSRTQDHLAPTVQQLGNPQVFTPGVPVLDPITGQTVNVTTVSGGNPDLKADSRQVMKVGLTLKPWADREFTFTANYIQSDIKNTILSIPGSPTPQLEAIFPDAYIRNAQGQLTEVDETPQNFADQARQELRWGFNFATPVGPPPKPNPNALPSFRRTGGDSGSPGGSGGSAGQGAGPAGPGQGGGQGSGGQGSGGQGSGGSGRGGGGGGWGGPGGGGRGGGGGGYGGFRAAQQGRFQIALYHTVYFDDQILAVRGAPILDLLNGGAVGANGGQYRHEIEGQLGYTKSGFGVRFSADWKSPTKVDGGTSVSDLSFSQIGTLNLRVWDNFGAQPQVIKRWRYLRGARLTLEVTNLFDTRQGVHDGAGDTPLAYQPGYMNPAGRVIEVSLRKLFF